ncbi:MAG: hypothetical protein U0586_12815 [Candidatus Brocadiaceae bacterium]
MKTYKFQSLLCCILLSYCTSLAADQSLQSSLPESNYKGGMLPEQEFANYISERNKNKTLPELEYWGACGVEWGGIPEKRTGKDMATGVEESFLDMPSLKTPNIDVQGKLTGITRHFAKNVKLRAERLKIFQELKKKLIVAYNEPTHPFNPDVLVGGKDGYVRGVQPFYLLEWQGTETIVSLRLSDDDLSLEFRQSPYSKASVKRENARLGKVFFEQEKDRKLEKTPGD